MLSFIVKLKYANLVNGIYCSLTRYCIDRYYPLVVRARGGGSLDFVGGLRLSELLYICWLVLSCRESILRRVLDSQIVRSPWLDRDVEVDLPRRTPLHRSPDPARMNRLLSVLPSDHTWLDPSHVSRERFAIAGVWRASDTLINISWSSTKIQPFTAWPITSTFWT